MSIIADALTRLQGQSQKQSHDSASDESIPSSPHDSEKPIRDRNPLRNKPWLVGIAIAVSLGSVAIAAYWVGWHLDFGLGADSQARAIDHPSPPITLDQPQEESFDTPPGSHTQTAQVHRTESIDATRPDILNSSPVPADPNPDRKKTGPQSGQTKTSLIPTNTETAASTQGREEATLPTDEEQAVLLREPFQEDNGLPPSTAPQKRKSGESDVYSVQLEEEVIQNEEFVITSLLSPQASNTPTSTSSMSQGQERHPAGRSTPTPRRLSPHQRLQQARKLIQAREYEQAVRLLAPLFRDPPPEWQPWFWMGTALLGKGDIEKADQFFLSGLARNDKIPQLWIQRALVAQQRGNYQLAIHELRQAESLQANLPHIHLNLGYAYEQMGNDRLANQYYGKFLQLSEGNPEFFSTRKKILARFTELSTKPRFSPEALRSPKS